MSSREVLKIFVSNIPWTIGVRELKQYFTEFGHVANSYVAFDRNSGLSKGYGFITFSTKGGFEATLKKGEHALEGRSLTIQSTGNNDVMNQNDVRRRINF